MSTSLPFNPKAVATALTRLNDVLSSESYRDLTEAQRTELRALWQHAPDRSNTGGSVVLGGQDTTPRRPN